jgi:hypothetical protein
MKARALVFVLAGLSIFVPRLSRAQAPEKTAPPEFRFSIESIDIGPPPEIAAQATAAIRAVGVSARTAAPETPPLFDLMWSNVFDRTVAEFNALANVSATAISSILESGPVDVLIPPTPGPWIPAGTPPHTPTGVRVGPVRFQPVALITPAPASTDGRGQQLILPSAVVELPWMTP